MVVPFEKYMFLLLRKNATPCTFETIFKMFLIPYNFCMKPFSVSISIIDITSKYALLGNPVYGEEELSPALFQGS